jgi:hypothetical protein
MKLNLLPTYVSKGKQAAVAWIAFALIVVVSVLATLGMMRESTKMVENQKARVKEREPYVAKAVRLSEIAGEVLNNAQGVILNSMLAESMLKHNAAYPDFYDGAKPYIPSFYRITSMTAAPLDADNATLTLTGVIQTQGQYRDLMLALNKIPEVRAVARTGYDIVEQYVPKLVEIDQTGRPIARSDSNIPDDPLARLDYLMAKGGISGFSGAGGFGVCNLPGRTTVTVTTDQLGMAPFIPGSPVPNPPAPLKPEIPPLAIR